MGGFVSNLWSNIFDNYGIKTVSKTDKGKGAYVPTAGQLAAIAAAGISPSKTRPAAEFPIAILFDSVKLSVKASFYHSERVTDPNRKPEPRMGHEFISSSWLNTGDKIIIGNIGSQLFAAKIQASSYPEEEVVADIFKKASDETVLYRAKQARGKPARKIVERQDYVRNPFVVKAAIIRSRGTCETPDCNRPLFPRDDGSPYMEVHHIIPLGEGGDDALVNVAALCPHCHRELHFGKNRMGRRAALAAYVKTLP